ncbi:MAG: acyl-CoA dehydrogenase family protein [Dehalococcoidia bacterium]|jgi:alkylation response protein AidB-like acyl-CoA dehydrogenase|uniref:Acyl-CoA dehydrogenase n=1 Tax=marine metagenome TaxID=408172 RepID=A0A381ZDF0_9ZZZZ|nr:acyl-CoA dehydrogenase family protein [SAR202 cluster bacterium]MCS5649189.1 acyl-CoA dehydrogenase family protein [Dehalococcoidia bacterium]MEC7913775.1 acyl-CoA dehydrogenase family protein [Chloroflexota bacterium]HAT21963.1 acyl-CoA dehydrogenase [Dehalococcoidia bacterium]|tara:strand:- start:1840 stop:3012 length:1173 start_codon:yes stop_codon:yes gene_type:complete
MDFEFSNEELSFRNELSAWLKDELANRPQEGGNDADAEWAFGLEMRKKLADKGWLTMAWPEEYGGQGVSHMMQVVFAEEMSYTRAPGRDVFGTRMMAPTLMIHGTEEQKREFLPPVSKGEVQWCQGYSEPESGSDLASLQTRAVEDGDDFIINGTKIWTSSAHRADHIMVLTRTDPDAPKHRGISFLLCDMNTPGLTVNPIINMAGDHGFNMVTFDNVRVPKKNLVGEQNRGWYVGATLLDFERSGVDYSAGGRRVLEELIAYAKDNDQNGSLIASNAIMRNRLADLAIEVDVSRLISYNIAWMQGEGLVPNKESSMGKIVGTELQQHLSETGMQMLGLHGQLEPGSKYAPMQGRIEHMHLTNVSETIQAGTSEIQRNIIATRGLGLPRG